MIFLCALAGKGDVNMGWRTSITWRPENKIHLGSDSVLVRLSIQSSNK